MNLANPLSHPSADDIRSYVIDENSSAFGGHVRQHLSECAECELISQKIKTEEIGRTKACSPVLTTADSGAVTISADVPIVSDCESTEASAVRSNDETLILESHHNVPTANYQVQFFGDYQVLGEIARGGMGVVYRARQVKLNRLVALKTILTGQFASSSDVTRFYTEAEAAARLNHPGIVPIYEVGQHDGQHYFSMALVDGESLAARVAKGPLPAQEAARLLQQIAEAVAYAHEQGVVHRDLKPGNVLLDKAGQPLVTDFGLAKHLEGESGTTQTGTILGTPAYMSPEQARGETSAVSPQADVYSLGAILYCLLVGRPPFHSPSIVDTLEQVVHAEPLAPRLLIPGVPRDLETICLKCLEKLPTRRYSTAAALADDLRRCLAGEPIQARATSQVERVIKWARRKPAVASLLAVSLLAMLAVGMAGASASYSNRLAASLSQTQREREHTEAARKQLDVANRQLARSNEQLGTSNTQLAASNTELAAANQRAEIEAYYRRLGLVDAAWNNDELRDIPKLLDECPPELRGWEWRYLRQLLNECRLQFVSNCNNALYTPDGQTLLTIVGDRNCRVQVRDPITGTARKSFNLPGIPAIASVAVNRAGLLAIAGRGKVSVWDLVSEQMQTMLHDGALEFSSVDWSPDGASVAAVSTNGEDGIWIWNANGELRYRLKSKGAFYQSVAFSLNGKQLAAGGTNWHSNLTPIDIWDLESQQVVHSMAEHNSTVNCLAWIDGDNRLVSGSKDKTLKIWNLADEKVERTIDLGFNCLRFSLSSDERNVAVASGSSPAVRIFSLETGRNVQTLKGHTAPAVAAYFHPDNQSVVTGGADGVTFVWDVGDSRRNYWKFSADAHSIAISPNNQWFAVSLWQPNQTGQIDVRNILTGEVKMHLVDSGLGLSHIAFSPDGQQLAAAGNQDFVWDLNTGEKVWKSKAKGYGNSVAYSPDGQILVTVHGEKLLAVMDAHTGELIREVEFPSVGEIAINPQGLIAIKVPNAIELRELQTGALVKTLQVPWALRIFAIAFSPDGRNLAISYLGKAEIGIWSVESGKELARLTGHFTAAYAVAFSPDGHRLASIDGHSIRIWDLDRYRQSLRIPTDGWKVCFSHDGLSLWSNGLGGTVRRYNATSIEEK